MDGTTLFARMPATPAPLIAQVKRDLERIAADERLPTGYDLGRLAEAKVTELWDSRVKVFVPLLALRAAREELDARIRDRYARRAD
jgi:hypothetical protein